MGIRIIIDDPPTMTCKLIDQFLCERSRHRFIWLAGFHRKTVMRLMGRYTNGRIFNMVAWSTTILMTVLTFLIILTTLFPGVFGGS